MTTAVITVTGLTLAAIFGGAPVFAREDTGMLWTTAPDPTAGESLVGIWSIQVTPHPIPPTRERSTLPA